MSSGFWRAIRLSGFAVEPCAESDFPISVGALSYLESVQALAGDVELFGRLSEDNAEGLTSLSQPGSDGQRDGGIFG